MAATGHGSGYQVQEVNGKLVIIIDSLDASDVVVLKFEHEAPPEGNAPTGALYGPLVGSLGGPI